MGRLAAYPLTGIILQAQIVQILFINQRGHEITEFPYFLSVLKLAPGKDNYDLYLGYISQRL